MDAVHAGIDQAGLDEVVEDATVFGRVKWMTLFKAECVDIVVSGVDDWQRTFQVVLF